MTHENHRMFKIQRSIGALEKSSEISTVITLIANGFHVCVSLGKSKWNGLKLSSREHIPDIKECMF